MASRIFTPGTVVELMLSGLWTGRYTVTHHGGRSPEHLVLRAKDDTFFEVYNDAPNNIREVTLCAHCSQPIELDDAFRDWFHTGRGDAPNDMICTPGTGPIHYATPRAGA